MINLMNILIMLLMVGIVIVLQVFLSKSNSKIPGLIIPILFVMFSLISVANIGFSSHFTWIDMVGRILMVFILSNIPTLILVSIYYVIRERSNMNRQLDKMKIQDL
ncbi:MAG TPA: hypothetical protein VFH18_03320 [Erysipelotrichaceae bacterium]|nr:hypothetical protein [Erysipelotrichaceae bacterium]